MRMPDIFPRTIRKIIILSLPVFLTLAPCPTLAETKTLSAPTLQKDRISAMPGVYVREFKLEGNTVFSHRELSEITAPYENREITSEELQDLRRKLTQHYVDKGYVNSGVIIPDQKMTDGVLILRVVEGSLSKIEISGNQYFRNSYLEKRLKLGAGPPLNAEVFSGIHAAESKPGPSPALHLQSGCGHIRCVCGFAGPQRKVLCLADSNPVYPAPF